MTSQPSTIKNITIGILFGIFLAAILWFCAIYAHASISLIQGIISSWLFAIFCGITATFSGVSRRFTVGLLSGLYLAVILWLYSIYFGAQITLLQGIIGSLVLGTFCGTLATVSGIDKVFDNFPNI